MKKHLDTYLAEVKNVAQKGLFHLFTAHGLIYVAGFASQLFVAGILETDDIGRIKIMQTYIGLAALIGGLGFNTSLLKLAASNSSPEQKEKLLNLSLLVSFLSFFFLYLLILLLNRFGYISTDPLISRFFPIYSLFLLPLIIQSMYLAYYQANRQIKRMAMIQLMVKILSVGMIIVFSVLFKLQGYALIVPITGFMAIVALEAGLKPNFIKRIRQGFDFRQLPLMWKLAAFALLANLAGTLLMTMDVYLINYLVKDRTQVGFYMFAITLISIYQLIPASTQQVAFPFFSVKSENRGHWLGAYKKFNRLNHILIPLVVVAGMILVPPFIKIAFAGKYNHSLFFFHLLSIGWMFKSMNIMKGTALMGYGKFNLNFYGSLVSILISFPLMFLLISHYDLLGAAVARIAAGIITYLVTLLVFRHFLKSQQSGA